MIEEKIVIDSQYLKFSPVLRMKLEDYKLKTELDISQSKFYMVGNDIEVHLSNGTSLKLGDIDWMPKYSG